MLEKAGHLILLCFQPNSDVYALFTFTFAVVFSRVSLTNLINVGGFLFWVKQSNIFSF